MAVAAIFCCLAAERVISAVCPAVFGKPKKQRRAAI